MKETQAREPLTHEYLLAVLQAAGFQILGIFCFCLRHPRTRLQVDHSLTCPECEAEGQRDS